MYILDHFSFLCTRYINVLNNLKRIRTLWGGLLTHATIHQLARETLFQRRGHMPGTFLSIGDTKQTDRQVSKNLALMNTNELKAT